MNKLTLILFCGLPGSGKTTLGKQLAKERGVLRFCTDDWMADRGLDLQNEALHEKSWRALWETAWQTLAEGQSLLFEDGLWTKEERDTIRRKAKEVGAITELNYFDIPLEELIRRLEKRNKKGGHGVGIISEDQIREYAKVFQKLTQAELKLFDKVTVHSLAE